MMMSSAGACGRDVKRHLASDHELHSTNIPCCEFADVVRHSTSGLVAEDMGSVIDVSEHPLRRQENNRDGRTTGCIDSYMSSIDNRSLQDVSTGREAASTWVDDATRSHDNSNDDAVMTPSRQRAYSFSSSDDTIASPSTVVYRSYMHLRSKTNR